MTRWLTASMALLAMLNSAHAQVHAVADLPFPPDFHLAPPSQPPAGPPYNRAAGRYFCTLALEHPPFPQIPFAETRPTWLAKCTNQFLDLDKSSRKRAETLVCEMRATDVLAEAARYGIASDALPPLPSFLAKCEREFRTDTLHLPPLAPAPQRPPEGRASFFVPTEPLAGRARGTHPQL